MRINVKQKTEELEAMGECTIIQTEICTIINTANKGINGKVGRPSENRKGHYVIIDSNICLILINEYTAEVDTDIFFKFKIWEKTWRVDNNSNFVLSGGDSMHRLICKNLYGKEKMEGIKIAHKNGNKLDNKICNLKIEMPIDIKDKRKLAKI